MGREGWMGWMRVDEVDGVTGKGWEGVLVRKIEGMGGREEEEVEKVKEEG